MEAVILVRLDSIVLSCAFLGVMEKLKRHLGLSNGQKAVITSGDKNPGAQISRKKPTTCVGRRDNCFLGALLWTVRNGKKKVIQERQRKRREKTKEKGKERGKRRFVLQKCEQQINKCTKYN